MSICQKSQPFVLFNDSYETDTTRDSSNEPYCGKYSSLNHPSLLWALQGNPQSYTSLVSSYPYVSPYHFTDAKIKAYYMLLLSIFCHPCSQVCLAYRGAVPSNLFVSLGYISSTSVWTTTQIDLFVNATITRDLGWHFNCFDIRTAISASATISSGQFHTIIQVSFASYGSQSFWVDEFAITRTPVTCECLIICDAFQVNDVCMFFSFQDYSQTPAVRPAGVFVDSVSVVTTVPSKPTLSLSVPLLPNVTSTDLLSGLQLEVVRYTLTYTVPNCGSGIGPVSATIGAGQPGSVTVLQLVQGSPAISGTFALSFQGYMTGNLAATTSAYALQTQLQNSFGGQFSVSQGGTCAGYYWDITWVTAGGDKPLIVANGTGLQGINATINVVTLVNGGVYIRPFRGDMLRLPKTMPQVSVTNVT